VTIIKTNMNNPKVISAKKESLRKLGYRDLKHWLENPNHVYIGRDMSFYVEGAKGSKWKNPFPVKKHGLDECIRLYEEYLMNNEELLKDIEQLRGKNLACWCKNNGDEPCHGDILLRLANANKTNISKENPLHSVDMPKFTKDDFPPLK
jgi:hypothetical protein